MLSVTPVKQAKAKSRLSVVSPGDQRQQRLAVKRFRLRKPCHLHEGWADVDERHQIAQAQSAFNTGPREDKRHADGTFIERHLARFLVLQRQLAVIAGEDEVRVLRQAQRPRRIVDPSHERIRLGAHGKVNPAQMPHHRLIEPVTPRLGHALIQSNRMVGAVYSWDIDRLIRNPVQPVAIRSERRVGEPRADTQEKRLRPVLFQKVHRPVNVIPIALMAAYFVTRIHAKALRFVLVEDGFVDSAGAQPRPEPRRWRVTPRQIIKLPEIPDDMGFGEFAEQRPHPRLKPFVVAPTLAMVRVPPGPHIGARRAADGVGAVSVLEEGAGLRNAVDVRRRMAERRMPGTSEHAAIPAFGVEENDIRSRHRSSGMRGPSPL